MKTLRIVVALLLCVFVGEESVSQTFSYISPKDHSVLVSLKTNIILKSTEKIDPSSLSPNDFAAVGTISGKHTGVVKLSDDGKTVLFIPIKKFTPDEDVTVTVIPGIRTLDGGTFSPITFQFKTTPLDHPIESALTSPGDGGSPTGLGNTSSLIESPDHIASTDSLPTDFPQVTVGTSNNPAPGGIFLTNKAQGTGGTYGFYLMIFNNDGSVARYKKLAQNANLFKMEPNGNLSWSFANGKGGYFVIDTAFAAVDTFLMGNGYGVDAHDFVLLPNGHAILFSNDQQLMDMSQVVPGGSPNAIVTGMALQEVDASKNVVFQWRNWDYLPLTASYFDLTSQNVDLIHQNGFVADNDGNILICMRHLSSIVKVNRETGDIMWILGGKLNQFTFINEHESNAPTYFSYPHHVSVLPNGNITIYDNGNQHSPQYSRGVEYKLDLQKKTATMVWEFRHTPDIYSNAMGSVQRLPGGNTIVGWGSANGAGIPSFTEVTPTNATALEMSLPVGQISYRALKFPWVSQVTDAAVTLEVLPLNTYRFNHSSDTTGVTIKFNKLSYTLYANVVVSRYSYAPVRPKFTGTAPRLLSNYFNIKGLGIASYTGDVRVNLRSYPAVTNPGSTIVYMRSKTDSSFVPLATGYDSTSNELAFTTSTFGDFAFGIPETVDSAYVPVPFSPKDSAIVNGVASVKLVWGTRGIVQTYRLQVSTDASFGTLVVDKANLSSTSYVLSSVNNNATYYWRVNNTNAAGTSTWSPAVRFITASPFITVLSPNGGERLYRDSTYVIRWQSNFTDTVSIRLMSGATVAASMGDSMYFGTNAIQWKVPSTVPPDTTYKVRVYSISNASISDLSNSSFTIASRVSGVENSDNTVTSYSLYQNYPNPFNPTTVVSFQLPVARDVRLVVYDLLGREVKVMLDERKAAGRYQVEFDGSGLASGVYVCRLTAGQYVASQKMALVR